jgi:hypothetical protein
MRIDLIILVAKDAEIISLVRHALFSAALAGCAISLALLVIQKFQYLAALNPYQVGIATTLQGICNVLWAVYTRRSQYVHANASRFLFTFSFIAAPILLFGLKILDESNLILIYISILTLTCMPLMLVFQKSKHIPFSELYKRYRGYLYYTLPQCILDAIQINAFNAAIVGLYGQSVFGLYALAYRLLFAPLGIISSGFNGIIISEFRKKLNESPKSFYLIFLILAKAFLGISICFGIGIYYFFSSTTIDTVFPALNISKIAVYVMPLLAWACGSIIFIPVYAYLLAASKNGWLFVAGVAVNSIPLLSVNLAYSFGFSINGTLQLTSFGIMVVHLSFLLYYMKISYKGLK